jgi:hypothetical protein
MTIGHYPDRVLVMLVFSGFLVAAWYFCRRAGVIPTNPGSIRRDKNPRIFALTLVVILVLAAVAAASAIAIYCGYGLDLISK